MTIPTDNEQLVKFAAEQAQRVVKKIPLLGPVSWLMMNNPTTRHAFLVDLEWRVMPALVLDQAKLYMRGEMPTAFVTWAYLSDQVAERYAKPPYHLAPGDWKSGDKVFLVDVFAPYGGPRRCWPISRRQCWQVRRSTNLRLWMRAPCVSLRCRAFFRIPNAGMKPETCPRATTVKPLAIACCSRRGR